MAKMTPFLWYQGNVAEAMGFLRSGVPRLEGGGHHAGA